MRVVDQDDCDVTRGDVARHVGIQQSASFRVRLEDDDCSVRDVVGLLGDTASIFVAF